jgi:hypothetical protein
VDTHDKTWRHVSYTCYGPHQQASTMCPENYWSIRHSVLPFSADPRVQAPAARARERSARRGQPPAAAEQEEPQPPTHLPPSRRSSLPRPSWPGPLFFKSVNVAHQYRCSSSWMCGFVCLWCLCGACTRKCGGAAHAASEHYCCCHCCRCCRRVTIICRRHQNACGGGPTLYRWCW